MRNKRRRNLANKKLKLILPTTRKARGPSQKFKVHIFCDGSCAPNPGPAASSSVIYIERKLHDIRVGRFNPDGTNNTAELEALRLAFRSVNEMKLHEVEVISDSDYAIKSIERACKWSVKGKQKNCPNLDLILAMYSEYKTVKDRVSLALVKSHRGIEGNEIADVSSKAARIFEIGEDKSFPRSLIEAARPIQKLKPSFLESVYGTKMKTECPETWVDT
jgi:ribonuclease HI